MSKKKIFMTASVLAILSSAVAAPAQATTKTPVPPSTQAALSPSEVQARYSLSSLDVGDPVQPNTQILAYSYSYPGGMNAAEFRFCSNPLNANLCLKAKNAADDALNQAKQRFPVATLSQGKGDAFRHCYWNARMTVEMGEAAAKGFGDRHESETPAGADKNMDLANNTIGRGVGRTTNSVSQSLSTCESRARAGTLYTLR